MLNPSHMYYTQGPAQGQDIKRAAFQNAHRTGRPVTVHFHFRSRKSRKGKIKYIGCGGKECYTVLCTTEWPPGQELFREVMAGLPE